MTPTHARRRLLRGCAIAIVVLTAAIARADQADTLFAAGVKAFRAEQWSQAASLFERARAMKANESGRVQISGNDVVEYLPSYYLGQALLQMKNCSGALDAWRVAEQIQGVRGDRGMMRTIADGRKRCPAGPTPAAVDDGAWTRALGEAETAEKEAQAAQQGLAQAIGSAGDAPSKAVAPMHDQATKTLQSASSQLNQARQQKDASAAQGAAGGFRTASRQFGDAQRELQKLVTDASTRYDAARATAQASIGEAADAERKAVAGSVPAPVLQGPRGQLAQARTAFDEATRARSAEGMQNAQKLSAASRDAFTAAIGSSQSLGGARTAVGQAQASAARLEKLLAGRPPSATAATAIQAVARAAQSVNAANPSAADITAAGTAAASARDTLDRESDVVVNASVAAATAKLDAAARELDRADATARNPGVKATSDERGQLGGVRGRVERTRHDADQARTTRDPAALSAVDRAADEITAQITQLARALEARLASASGIPAELMAAAGEFFAGRYDAARAAIDRLHPGDHTADIRLQIALFRSAIAYGLFVRSGERDAALKQAAAASAAECRRLVPSYSPDPRAFSPRFVKFYNGS